MKEDILTLLIAEDFTGPGFGYDLFLDDLYVPRDVLLASTVNGAIRVSGPNHIVQIFGSAFGITGVWFRPYADTAGRNTLQIGKTGQVSAAFIAIDMSESSNTVVNHGELSSLSSTAVMFRDVTEDIFSRNTFTNFGTITSAARAIDSGNISLSLKNYGEITSSDATVILLGRASDKVVNYGRIDGDVDLGDGSNALINRGFVVGDLVGGPGADRIDNRGGTITGDVNLGEGDDYYTPGASEETVDGGIGFDRLDFTRSNGVRVALDGLITASKTALGDNYTGFEGILGSYTGADVLGGNAQANELYGYGGNDKLSGQAGQDLLGGGEGNDILDGGADIDNLDGGAGNDTLIGGGDSDGLLGGAGNDKLNGGTGKDSLSGGLGADIFVFAEGDSGASSATADVILDFSQAERDRIDLSLIDARTKVAGDQAFTFVGTAAFTKVAGQLRYIQSGGDTFVQGDTNGDGIADFWIGLAGATTLKAGDFLL